MYSEPGAPAVLAYRVRPQDDRTREVCGDVGLETISGSTYLDAWGYADAALEATILELLHGIEFTTMFNIGDMFGRPPLSRHSEFAVARDIDVDVGILQAWQLKERSNMRGRWWGVHLHSEGSVSEEYRFELFQHDTHRGFMRDTWPFATAC